MSTNERLASWRWNDDGNIITGTVLEVRTAPSKFREGALVTILDVELEGGDRRSVWCDAYGLRRFIEVSMPRAGDAIRIERTGKKEFTTKSGEQRSMWEFESEILPTGGGGLPVTEPAAVSSDDDIPF